jgi:4-hydroxy 2-oxovalerate aldolase
VHDKRGDARTVRTSVRITNTVFRVYDFGAMGGRVRLLDATIRDGSYCVDFQFTAADIAILIALLDEAGVGYIELGHGSGTFHHKAPPNIRSATRQAATDEAYFAAARAAAPHAKIGVITGTFGKDDLHTLVEHRIDFVRMAVMADKAVDPANLAMAESAKSLGLVFSVNLMQTIAITPARCAEIAAAYAKVGADWFYIVDSSGGMLPKVVGEYIAQVRGATDMTIGFHAHHNSGLAIANCLVAIEAGAVLVDGTLQGLGRDIGNAPTEQLLLLLQRHGHERAIDVELVCRAGDLVRGLVERGNDPTYYAAGSSEVHSSNVPALVALAESRGLPPRALLAAIAQGEKRLIGAGMKTFPEDIIAPAIARLPPATASEPRGPVIEVVADEIARASAPALPVLAQVLFARAAKWHRRGVLHVVPADQLPFAGPLAWEIDQLCGFTVGVADASALAKVDLGDRRPDVLVVDPALAGGALPAAPQRYVDAFQPILVEATIALANAYAQRGARVSLVCRDAALGELLAARADRRTCQIVAADAIARLAGEVQAGDGVIFVDEREPPAGASELAARGAQLLRPALASAIAAHLALLLDIHARLALPADGELVDAIRAPAAGQIAVDDLHCPGSVVAGNDSRADALTAATARAHELWRGKGRL